MFLTLYFPLAASLSVHHLPDGFLNKIRDGDLQPAGAQASRWSDIARGAAAASCVAPRSTFASTVT